MVNIWQTLISNLQARNRMTNETANILLSLLKSNPESTIMAKEMIKAELTDILVEPLNEAQKSIFNNVVKYIDGDDEFEGIDAFMINGYAGTGKTFLIKRIIEYICAVETGNICVTAPTNKAVKVLAEGMDTIFIEDGQRMNSDVCYCTTHKYLNLKEAVDDEGNISFIPQKGNNPSFKFLVIDEASMIGKDIAKLVFDVKSNVNQKLILLGDVAQIPPVGEPQSVLFSKDFMNIHVENLTEIVRQKNGNPIIDYSIMIRENANNPNPIKNKENKESEEGGVVFMKEKKDAVNIIEKMLHDDSFKENSSFFKIIAWRNKTLDYLNGFCRKKLFGENVPKFVKGDKVIANSSLYDSNYKVIVNTSQEMIITECEKKTVNKTLYVEVFNKNMSISIPSYYIEAKVENGRTIHMYVPDEQGQYLWLNFMSKIKYECIKKRKANCWANYYDLGKIFANIGYAYAISAHKSQGSTYKNVLLMDIDVDNNWNVLERNKIRYTSFTRASNNLYVL